MVASRVSSRLGWAIAVAVLWLPAPFAPAWAGAAAEVSPPLSITVPVVSEGPVVDGTLNSPVWKQAASVKLSFDRLTQGPSAEPTTVYIVSDGKAIYVAFDAVQTRSAIVTNQHNNNSGVDTDDEVKVALWPSGKSGINYQFISTPIGTRYQYSTENLSYEPTWQAVGKVAPGRYVLTMRIPLAIMHGAAKDRWLANFTRWETTTGSLYAWSGGPSFQGTPDQNFARPLLGLPQSVAVRPQPRVGMYGLGVVGAPSAGGDTSRMGVDLSLPVTSSVALIASLHPDFSNVEQDQQSIAPTAFRRFYLETRPFFTQGANYYNVMECDACPNEQSLYTPSIPTPRDGYAIEGKAGPATFGAFDAVGNGRNDNAESVTFRNDPQTLFASFQRVSTNGAYDTIFDTDTLPGQNLRDDTLQFGTKYDDLQHKFVYANYGTESASSNWIGDPSQAKFEEIGAGWYGPHSFTGGGVRSIGAQYDPVIGFFTHPSDSSGNLALGGYGVFSQHTWTPNGGIFKQIQGTVSVDRYHGYPGLDQSDTNASIDFKTRTLWEFQQNVGSSYLWSNLVDPQFPNQPAKNLMAPVTQESTSLTYHAGTATPTNVTFATGRYGYGRLDSWFRSTTFKAGQRGLLGLELDTTSQYFAHAAPNVQWLERASYTYVFDADTSLAIGVRRFFGPPPSPNGGSSCIIPNAQNPEALGFCPNISLAFHHRLPHDELYVIYGNASQTLTVPQFLAKLIHYFGAEKGT